MPQIVQQGQINLAALNVPDLIVQIIPPQLLINGVPSNIVGMVGTAAWGPTNVPAIVGGYGDYTTQFGNPQPRKYDIGSALWAATMQGAQAFRIVRVTDGTDTAASVVLQVNCLTIQSLYTGSLGNTIGITIRAGSQLNTLGLVTTMGSLVPEIFDNVSQGIPQFTVTAGTYTQCPLALTISAPDMPGGVQAVAYPILSVQGNPTVSGTMTGYVANDIVTFQNQFQIKVLTVTGGAITTFSILNPGVVTAGQQVPASLTQISTTGAGTGAQFTSASWGLGVPSVQTIGSGYVNSAFSGIVTNGSNQITSVSSVLAGTTLQVGMVLTGTGIPSSPATTITAISGTTITMSANATSGGTTPITVTAVPGAQIVGGTFSVSGSVVPVLSFWPNFASAVNNGVSGLRGPSLRVTATAGAGTATPTQTGYKLSGGTDGANPANIGIQGVPAIVGQDAVPRTGMFAMRSAFISIGVLVDVDDSTTWSNQTSFGLSEGIYMIGTGPSGDSIANATNVLNLAGVDSFAFKLMFGDWVYINDPITGALRLISPQGFVAGFMGNQDPSQTPMNKEMEGIVGTQKSQTKIQYTNADLQALSLGRIDVITNPNPGGNYFGLRLGINTSSNLAVNGDNYTRLTFFIAETIDHGLGFYVGQLQTQSERYEAQTTLAAFFANLEFLGLIGTADGSPSFKVQINDANNPFTLVSLGYQFAFCQVTYLSVIRYFIIDLQAGQTVQVTDQLPIGTGSATANSQAPTIG